MVQDEDDRFQLHSVASRDDSWFDVKIISVPRNGITGNRNYFDVEPAIVAAGYRMQLEPIVLVLNHDQQTEARLPWKLLHEVPPGWLVEFQYSYRFFKYWAKGRQPPGTAPTKSVESFAYSLRLEGLIIHGKAPAPTLPPPSPASSMRSKRKN